MRLARGQPTHCADFAVKDRSPGRYAGQGSLTGADFALTTKRASAHR